LLNENTEEKLGSGVLSQLLDSPRRQNGMKNADTCLAAPVMIIFQLLKLSG
jgi:hypothetical protein